jgi:hypothetical protein
MAGEMLKGAVSVRTPRQTSVLHSPQKPNRDMTNVTSTITSSLSPLNHFMDIEQLHAEHTHHECDNQVFSMAHEPQQQ